MLLLSDTKKLIKMIIGFEPKTLISKTHFFFKIFAKAKIAKNDKKKKTRQIESVFCYHCYLTVFMQIAKPKPQIRQK